MSLSDNVCVQFMVWLMFYRQTWGNNNVKETYIACSAHCVW